MEAACGMPLSSKPAVPRGRANCELQIANCETSHCFWALPGPYCHGKATSSSNHATTPSCSGLHPSLPSTLQSLPPHQASVAYLSSCQLTHQASQLPLCSTAPLSLPSLCLPPLSLVCVPALKRPVTPSTAHSPRHLRQPPHILPSPPLPSPVKITRSDPHC